MYYTPEVLTKQILGIFLLTIFKFELLSTNEIPVWNQNIIIVNYPQVYLCLFKIDFNIIITYYFLSIIF